MHEKHQVTSKAKGFTLIELIVVIAIISVLCAIFIPSLIGFMEKAFNAADCENARAVCTALKGEVLNDMDCLPKLTKNPWGAGVNADGTSYKEDDHGYVYVSRTEIRVSSYRIAKILEEHGFLDSAGSKQEEIKEYKYSREHCPHMVCKSSITWYRYQINIYERNGFVEFSYSATAKATEQNNNTGMSSGNNKIDSTASEAFAKRLSEKADELVSLG